MKKYLSIIIIIAIIIIGAVVYSHKSPTQAGEKQTVKIGLSLPLTGGVSFLGAPAQKAAELALKDAGVTKYNYDLVFEDDQFSPKLSATAASKLINVDKVLAIIEFGSATGNAINSIAENGKTVEFALASDPTVAKGVYNYVHWTPPFMEGQLLAKELIRRNYKKVSIIDTNHPGPLAVTNAVRDSLEGSSVQIASYDLTNVGEKDFKTIITKIKKANPDIVVLEMFSPEIEIATKQMRELGLNTPVTSVETFEWSSEPSLFENSWFVSDSIVPSFATKFKTAYGIDPAAGSSYVYDLVSMLIRLQEKQDKPIDPAVLPAIITAMGTWDSPVFGPVQIDKDGFFITNPSVKMIKGGKVISAN